MPGIRTASATTLAVVGLVLWLLQTYVFKGSVPSAVSAAVYTIVPAAIGWIFTHKALNMLPPWWKKQAAEKLKSGQPIVLPNSFEGGTGGPGNNLPGGGGTAA